MFSERLNNCFDSHVHWLATGEIQTRLSLSHLKNASDVQMLKVEEHHSRQDWILGFGWDQNAWDPPVYPQRKILDEVFGTRPVAFSRVDGHALWVNTSALERAGLLDQNIKDPPGGRILRDQNNQPTGVLIDKARKLVDRVIPKPSVNEIRHALLKGMQVFNRAGFTHIRDLSCSPEQWQEALHLEQSGLLTLAVEQFFSVEEGQSFAQALKLAKIAKQSQTKRLRPKGIKIYADGALGSEGALISCPYHSGSGQGLALYSLSEIKEMIKTTWEHQLEIAVHAIGDEAAHQVMLAFTELKKENRAGRLHLEHAELLRPETIELMKGEEVYCHLQPCHWLSDQKWLKQKIGDLQKFAFPWRALEEAEVKFDFGSDSPIEKPSVAENLLALKLSAAQGIPKLLRDPLKYHSHPDHAWVPNASTVFRDGQAIEVVFDGEHLG